ncbi:MAG: shikimate dehydrogenase [Actinomycetota bacterium]|nr:shikimate dehydrogenase [Actinomycetota bacterium]
MVTHRAGVLGSPIAHSLSPVLHTAAYRALGLTDWEYHAVDVDEAGFLEHVAALDDSWRGLSLTMPLKELAFAVVADVSAVAAATGAVNTLLRRPDGGWVGDNTDVAGIARGLAESGVVNAKRAVIVGSGATARSAVAALADLGVRHVDFMVRGEVRERTLAQAVAAGLTTGRLEMGDWPGPVDVVVSTVPAGAHDAAATLPRGGGALLDVIYGGGTSELAVTAASLGYAVVPGTTMLLYQAAEQVRLMTGRTPSVNAMRAALEAALAARR